jgi:hypothetical protein
MPVHPFRPCAEQDDDTIPVQEAAYQGVRSGGGETPMSVKYFIRVKISILKEI